VPRGTKCRGVRMYLDTTALSRLRRRKQVLYFLRGSLNMGLSVGNKPNMEQMS